MDRNINVVRSIQKRRNREEGVAVGGQKPWQRNFTYFMIGASVLGQAYLGLQVYQTFSTKSANDLSLYSYIALTVGYIFWIFYASLVTVKMDFPVLLGSVIGMGLAIAVIVGIVMYGNDIWKL